MSREDVEKYGRQGATRDDLAKIIDDIYLYTDKNEQSVGRWLANDGFWESWITSWFTRNIKPGFVCIDIGSNYGYYTRIMEKLSGPNGHVHAIDANRNLIELLNKSILDYPVEEGSGVLTHAVAISDVEGKSILKIPTRYLGGSSIVYYTNDLPSNIPHEEWDKDMEVDTVLLDNVIDGHVDLIKIDIEGAEHLAWRGMQNVVEKTDVIVMEIGNYLPKEFIDELYSRFTIAIIENDGYDREISREEFNKLNDLIMGVLRKK